MAQERDYEISYRNEFGQLQTAIVTSKDAQSARNYLKVNNNAKSFVGDANCTYSTHGRGDSSWANFTRS